jgi:hypothetical protein
MLIDVLLWMLLPVLIAADLYVIEYVRKTLVYYYCIWKYQSEIKVCIKEYFEASSILQEGDDDYEISGEKDTTSNKKRSTH